MATCWWWQEDVPSIGRTRQHSVCGRMVNASGGAYEGASVPLVAGNRAGGAKQRGETNVGTGRNRNDGGTATMGSTTRNYVGLGWVERGRRRRRRAARMAG